MRFHLFAYWHDPHWKGYVGATVKIWDLARNLSALGHTVVLFIPRQVRSDTHESLTVVSIPYLNIGLLRHLSFSIGLTWFLLRQYRSASPDVIYARRMNSLIPAFYARLQRALFFFEVNDDPLVDPARERGGYLSLVHSVMQRRRDLLCLRACNRAFVITPELARRIAQSVPSAAEKIVVLPSGSNTELFQPLDASECRSRLRLSANNRYVGFVGTLLSHQGLDTLVDSAPVVLTHIPDCMFVIIGEGPMGDRWRALASRRGVLEKFLFVGEVPYAEVPTWIGAMDLCVAPYRNSAGLRSPVKIFDYLACSRAVVASRIPGTTDVFEGLSAVTLVEPGDARALAATILQLLSDRQKLQATGATGRLFVLNGFDRLSLARRVSDCAQSLVATGGGPTSHLSI